MPDHYEDKINLTPRPRCTAHGIVEWMRGSNVVVTRKNYFAFNLDSAFVFLLLSFICCFISCRLISFLLYIFLFNFLLKLKSAAFIGFHQKNLKKMA